MALSEEEKQRRADERRRVREEERDRQRAERFQHGAWQVRAEFHTNFILLDRLAHAARQEAKRARESLGAPPSRRTADRVHVEHRVEVAEARAEALKEALRQMETFEPLSWPRTHPKTMAIACAGMGNLGAHTARKEHFCATCGSVAAKPGDEYFRNEHHDTFQGTEAWCHECAWRMFGPNGALPEPEYKGDPQLGYHQCGRGCLLDADSPEWGAHQERRGRRQAELIQQMFEKMSSTDGDNKGDADE